MTLGFASPVVVLAAPCLQIFMEIFLMNFSIVSFGFMLLAHSFFCLGLEGHNNAGLKTRACQSSSGRVLSLNRQADIGPHPAPQVLLLQSK
jgi:hypothetical protein